MENTSKDRKFNILFAWFDQGKDGYITRDDFQAMAKLFTALPGAMLRRTRRRCGMRSTSGGG